MYYDEFTSSEPFGQKLKAAREKAGYNIETLARVLHIRVDILQSIENNDFQKMPASGYCKNMVRSYARIVGLNQNEIANQYLDEYSAWERGVSAHAQVQQAASSQSSRRDSSRRSFLDVIDPSKSKTSAVPSLNNPKSSFQRTSAESAERDYSQDRRRSFYERYDTNQEQVKDSHSKMHPSYSLGGLPKPTMPRVNLDARKLMIAGAALIIIILLIVIIVMALGNRQAKQEEVPTMPISGLTDTSNKDTGTSNSSTSTATTTKKKTSAIVKVSCASGEESWCVIDVDGENEYADVMSGGSKTFTVKSSFAIQTGNPTPLTITVDNQEVTLTGDGTGSYYYEYYLDTGEDETSASTETTTTDATSTASEGATAGAGTVDTTVTQDTTTILDTTGTATDSTSSAGTVNETQTTTGGATNG